MIKFLLLAIIVFAVIWYIRRPNRGAQAKPPAPPPPPQDMVECPVCRVHLPRADALPGPDGQLYCCAEHRQRAA